MKKYLLGVSFFVAPLVFLAIPLDYLISNNLRKSNSYGGEFEVWNDIYSGNIDCDIAIYGSSRAWVQFNPQILKDSLNKKAYNFGIDGHHFKLQYLRHLEYMKHNEPPSIILLSLDIFSLNEREDLYNLEQFLPYMLWNSTVKNYTSEYLGFNSFDYYVPFLRYMGKQEAIISAIGNIGKREMLPKRQNGFASNNLEWNDDFIEAKNKLKSYEVEIDEENIALLESFISECETSGITLFLIYSPEYIDGQNFVSNRKEVILLYQELAQKYGLVFLDYSADEISFHKEFFYNASHLNSQGADLFTSKLAVDLDDIIRR